MTLVALAAAAAALVEALLALLVRTPAVYPAWAQSAAAGSLALVALLSLALGRLRAGQASSDRVRALRWIALAIAVAAGGVAIAAGVRTP
jgi:hypothetical protein